MSPRTYRRSRGGSSVDAKRATERLQVERSRIEQALAELAPSDDDELSDLDQHMADDASELFDEERDAGLAERLREELAAVGGCYGASDPGLCGTQPPWS